MSNRAGRPVHDLEEEEEAFRLGVEWERSRMPKVNSTTLMFGAKLLRRYFAS
jgi:hypothetical protein